MNAPRTTCNTNAEGEKVTNPEAPLGDRLFPSCLVHTPTHTHAHTHTPPLFAGTNARSEVVEVVRANVGCEDGVDPGQRVCIDPVGQRQLRPRHATGQANVWSGRRVVGAARR